MERKPTNPTLSRRHFFGTTTASLLAVGGASSANAFGGPVTEDDFPYEVTRSDAEWRTMLSKDEYNILRKGGTELPKTSPLWEEAREGMYHCKGCDLPSFDGRWKVVLRKGWAFFTHSQPNAVMTAIDGPVAEYGAMANGPGAFMEIHCRRCGSHLGHLLRVEGKQVHCINGTALNFLQSNA